MLVLVRIHDSEVASCHGVVLVGKNLRNGCTVTARHGRVISILALVQCFLCWQSIALQSSCHLFRKNMKRYHILASCRGR